MAVRPFTIDDIEGVNALHRAIHWPVPSRAQWQWLMDNPARSPHQPMGWVLDSDGRIDGFLGNHHRHVFREGQRFTAAAAYSVIVAPRAKGSLRELMQPFMAQPDVFAATILNANALASPKYLKKGMMPLAAGSYEKRLAWVLAPTVTALSKLLRISVQRFEWIAPLLGQRLFMPSKRAFNADSIRWPRGVRPVDDLSDSSPLGDYWQALRAEGHLVSDRSPATLHWYRQQPDLADAPLMLGFHNHLGLVAYVLLQLSKTGPFDVTVLEMIDVSVLARAPADAMSSLIAASQTAAYKMGAAKLRLPIVPPSIMDAMGKKARTARDEGGWGHAFIHYTGDSAEFAQWQPTAFDGTDGFTLPRPQRRS